MLHSLHRGSVALGLLVVLAGWAPITVAHEKGVLKLANRRLVAGDTVQLVGEKFPKAQFVVTGVLGPQSNAHGPNEFLHIPTGKKVTEAMATVLADHHDRTSAAGRD